VNPSQRDAPPKNNLAEGEDVKMPNHEGFVGRMKNNWRQRANEKSSFRTELRVVPRSLICVLCALYLVALGVVFWVTVSVPKERPFGISVEPLSLELLAVFGAVTAMAVLVSAFVMFLGYIGSDAKRRGMSPVPWVLAALFIPYLIGFIIYFVVREPLPLKCPKCGATVASQFNFCPECQFNLRPNCPQCRLTVYSGDRFCPHCGFPLHSDASAPASAAEARP
jgi:hypothetical protein